MKLFMWGVPGLFLAFLGMITGCGDGVAAKDQLPVVPAKGKLLVRGQPMSGVNLLLVPVKADQKIRPQANTGADGSFEITTYKTGDGGPEGEYKVVLSMMVDPNLSDSKKEELAGKLAAEAKRIPAAYQRADTTPLTVKIEKGKADLGVLEIK